MDLQDLWQEHKRWILGLVAGLVVFWIAGEVIGAVFPADDAVRGLRAYATSARREQLYKREAKDQIEARHADLVTQEARLREAVAFRPDVEFVLAGKGDYDAYFPEIEGAVRSRLRNQAQELAVEFGELSWTAPVGREEIEETLIGLCALQHATQRLLEAGEKVRLRIPEALGVQAIESMKIERSVVAGAGGARRPGRPAAAGEDLVREQRIAFTVRCDVQTLQAWFESLRALEPRMALAPTLRVVPGEEIGDPLVVRGHISVVSVAEATTGEAG